MKKRILIIDDETEMAGMMSMRLRAWGYEVSVSPSGETGFEKALAEKPDLIILDVMLPGMDGYEVCRRLKTSPPCQGIPVILLTAVDQTSPQAGDGTHGADDCMMKPFEPKVLLEKIKTLIKKKGDSAA